VAHPRRFAAAVAAAVILAACGDPEHKSPFDPQTPKELQAKATLRGTVTLEPLGATTVSSADVTISVSGSGAGGATTDVDGAWVLAGVGPGTYTVRATHAGYEDGYASGVVVTLDDGDQVVTVPPIALRVARGALTGQVVLPVAASSAGIVVTATGPVSTATMTDAAGAFTLTGLPVGTYSVTARRDPDWQPATTAGVVVTPGAATAISASALQPWATASVAGTVAAEGLADQGGTFVTLSGTDFRGQAVIRTTTTASPGGGFGFGSLLAGSYQVAFVRAGWDSPPRVGVSVQTGQAADVGTASLPTSRGTIAGTVALSEGAVTGFQVGADRSGVVVTLSGLAPTRSAVTDVAGAYRFDAVPVGTTYTLTASKPSYSPAQTAQAPTANATVTAAALTLTVNPGAYAVTVLLRDAVNGAASDNATHGGTTVSLTGTAFNGTSWSAAAAANASTGVANVGNLPPGTYDVVATNAGRACAALPSAAVQAGASTSGGTIRCLDAVAPTALALGPPQAPPGGQSGYAAGTTVVVPVSIPASDATVPASNLRGYQIVVGSAADWASAAATIVAGQPGTLTFTGLSPNAANTLWARALDWIGNAGPVATALVVTDSIKPPTPGISTPRPFVNATTSSVTLSGSESDVNFAGYEWCVTAVAATGTCPAASPAGCSWQPTASTFAVSLPPNQRSCVYARAYDRAGNRSDEATLGTTGVVSDLVPPTPPVLGPSYDPTQLSVRAPWVDFFVQTPSTDLPAGGAAWQDVAWLEVDMGAGYEPLCASASCSAAGTWSPCGGCCSDARLLCNGTQFAGVRARLLEGTRNTIAFRAVDLAGNVGSGVSQQVEADSTADVVAATAGFDDGPNVRGRLIGYVSSSAGWLLDLGTNRRVDAADRSCQVSPMVASGYGRGVFPASDRLVVTAEWGNGIRMIRPGPDGQFCTSDDVSSVLRAMPFNFYADGVSGFGERVAWWERQNSPAVANLFVRDPGSNGVLGTGTDVDATFAFSTIDALTMGETSILIHQSSCRPVCATTWRVIHANASGSWTSGTTTYDLPASVQSAALSVDGRRLAWIDTGPVLRVLDAGKDKRFGTGDDVPASIAVPFSLNTGAALAVDGTHVVAFGSGSPVSYLVHWWAGPDGAFGTTDDVVEQVRPTAGYRRFPSLASSYLALGESSDLLGFDLSTLRWEAAPPQGISWEHLRPDGRGWLLYPSGAGSFVARSPWGSETAGPPSSYAALAVSGADLVHPDGSNRIQYRQPDATGAWFSATAPAPVSLYQVPVANYVQSLFLGDGKALELDSVYDAVKGQPVAHYHVLEPNAGTLATFPASGVAVDVIADGVSGNWATMGAITRDQAFYLCHAWSSSTTYLCVLNADPVTHRFTQAAAPPTFASAVKLVHPPGSPLAGQPFMNLRALRVSGGRMLAADYSSLYLFDAGPDGLFNTADDRERIIANLAVSDDDIDVAGDWVAWLDYGAPGGRQVWLQRGFDGVAVPVTSHYSAKRTVSVEASGRVFWADGLFVPEGVFVRAP
jgi:hypothetical protein